MKQYLRSAIAGLLLCGAATLPAQSDPPAALVYAGWYGNTIPTPTFVHDNVAFLETQPFDGLVVYLRDAGMSNNLTTVTTTNTPVSYATAMNVMSPLVGLPFNHLRENLGLVQISSPPDFFDDWSVPVANFANLARAARDSGLKGLCIDNEQYFSPWGDYPAKYGAKTLQEYRDQARLRGRQVMEAMVAQFPQIVVLTLHGPSVSEFSAPLPLFPQWQSGNELLGPLFSGMMEGVGSSGACNMDGGELYTLRSASDFAFAYNWNRNTIASAGVNCPFIPAALRPLWPGLSSISFGVYDAPFAGATMNATILRSTLANALRQADRYVWFYAEASTYLLPPASGGASAAWVDAIRQAKIDAGSGGGGSQAPAAPSALHSTGVTTSSVSMAWTDASTNENGFSIERWNGASWGQVGTVGAGVTTFTNGTLAPATTYRYRVLAFNGAGNSAPSNELTVTTSSSGSGVPAAPSGLAASSVSTIDVDLVWSDGSTNENGFSIERLSGSTWSQVGWVGANITTHRDAGLSPATPYRYRVLAFNGAGNSPTTNELAVTTQSVSGPQVPAAPTNLVQLSISTSDVLMGWTDASSNENGFSIERLSGSTWSQVGWVPDSITTFRDIGLSPATTYRYRVLAFNGAGTSPASNELVATTSSVSGPQVPAAPLDLRVTSVTSTTVVLAWTDASSNETGFSIERLVGGAWTQVGSVAGNITTYPDAGLSPRTSYRYRVRAFNAAGMSPPSNEIHVRTRK